LAMREYPADMRCLYAQGHSVSRFLVAAKGRQTFLAFVSDGLRRGWDDAVREQYGYKDVDHLEKAWLESLKTQAETSAQRHIHLVAERSCGQMNVSTLRGMSSSPAAPSRRRA